MKLAAIWRHPVKSLQGEQLSNAEVDSNGVRGDRCWGIRDERTGKILTARREPQLPQAGASLPPSGAPELTLPNMTRSPGVGAATDTALSAWLGRPVTLVPAGKSQIATAEYFADATDDNSLAIEWTMPAGRFVDAMAVLLLTTASLRAGSCLTQAGAGTSAGSVRTCSSRSTETDGWRTAGATRPCESARLRSCLASHAPVARWSPEPNPALGATFR